MSELLDGRYEVVRPLGTGGMSRVFLVRDQSIGELRALKRLHLADAEAPARMREEFAALARIEHPNLVRVFDFGSLGDGSAYFTMEVLEGKPLDLALAPGDVPGAMAAALDILAGLEALQASGIVHCDIKPQNLLVAAGADGSSTVRIVDLGLAGRVSDPSSQKVRGTPGYVAPEVLAGGPYTRESDLYGLGASLYRVLSGRPAFPGRDPAEILAVQRRGAPPLLPLRVANVPEALDAPLLGLLSADPAHRIVAARELEGLARRHATVVARVDVLRRSGPLVGREESLAGLARVLLQAKGAAAAVLVGPQGSGRTRLARELAIEAELRGLRVAWFDAEHVPTTAVEPDAETLIIVDDADAWADSAIAALPVPCGPALFVQARPPVEGDAIYRWSMRAEQPPVPTLVTIEGLEPGAISNLIAQRLGGPAPSEAVSRIVAAAGSLPGAFLLELDRWVSLGRLTRASGDWLLRPGDASEESPRILEEGETLLRRLDPEALEAAFIVTGWPLPDPVAEVAAIAGIDPSIFGAGLERLRWEGHLESDSPGSRIVPDSLSRALTSLRGGADFLGIRTRLRDGLLGRLSGAGANAVLALAHHEAALGNVEAARIRAVEAFEAAFESSPEIAEHATDLLLSLAPEHDTNSAETLANFARRWKEAGRALRADALWTAARDRLSPEMPELAKAWAMEHALLLTHMVQYTQAKTILTALLERDDLGDTARARPLSLRGWCRVRSGQRSEGLADLEQAIACMPETELSENAIAHMRIGMTLYLGGSTREGEPYLDKALELALLGGDPGTEARVRGNLGLRYRIAGDLDRAEDETKRAIELITSVNQLEQMASYQTNLLGIAYDRCDWTAWAEATRALEQSSRASGNPIALLRCFEARSTMGLLRGQLDDARRALRLQRPWLIPGEHAAIELFFEAQLGAALSWLGEEGVAGRMLRRVMRRSASASLPAVEAYAARCLAELRLVQGRLAHAMRYSRASIMIRSMDLALAVPALLTEARIALRRNDPRSLEILFTENAVFLGSRSSPELDPTRLELESYRLLLQSRIEDGEAALNQAVIELRRLDLAPREILAEWEFGLGCLSRGHADRAVKHLENAFDIASRCGIKGWARRIAECRLIAARQNTESPARLGPSAEGADLLPRVIELVNSIGDFPTLLRRALALAAETIGADRGFILLTEDDEHSLRPVAQHGIVDDESRSSALEISRTIVRRVTSSGQSFLTDDAGSDPRLGSTPSVLEMAVRSLICVPLRLRERVIGTIYLESRTQAAQFTSNDLDLVEAFANVIAVAIDNGRLHDELKRSRDRVISQNLSLRREVSKRFARPNIVGQSPEIERVLGEVERVAVARESVMITGASGTGKELIAKSVHFSSPRADEVFLSLNCAALSDDLIESELFGIERRVASNVDARAGIFERAHGGTLFLDEIGDMPLALQAKLLRVLQEHEFFRVGGTKAISVDFRLITATNQDLRRMIRDQRFREDLYFRIHQLPIDLPALHERRIDIPILAEHFIRKYCEENGRPVPRMSKVFVTTLLSSKWPGNVRELQYYVERIVVMSSGPVVEPIFLPSDLAEAAKRARTAQVPEFDPETSSDLKSALVDFEVTWIRRALETSNWNQREAARKLGLVEATLRYRMKGLGIAAPQVTGPKRGRPLSPRN